MTTSSFDLFDEKKLYRSGEIKKTMGISARKWKNLQDELDYITLGDGDSDDYRLWRYYSGKDLNEWLRMKRQ
tara:strand:+ start:1471 stop:1686 length:216 start_codon:yes stop_codon:yes gene_type:complete